MFSGIWIKVALPGAMFAVSVPLALIIETGVHLLWPSVYLAIALFSIGRRIATARSQVTAEIANDR
ncbi:hypothetical protein HCN51_51260 [Nonomuraea sp. FMUSA5-5]|uniref:Uncharacterized protein n=1 Tax=Nonomuraea composti TaxID=2720023 RepID=A0ABX1BR65_9ACTN|nr:hypothetical protein [Nonomuraea sp. FMUSA5-5]NJP97716.1 hypothetical protein [Nonomuraea sp. FMUSA5-5]